MSDASSAGHDGDVVAQAVEPPPSLRVGAHVLVQLGSELVTDAEQAILECVKNAYDADSPSCRITVNTRQVGVCIETANAGRLLKFRSEADGVTVEMTDMDGRLIDEQGRPVNAEGELIDGDATALPPEASVTRTLTYTGSVSIEDNGDGLTKEQLRSSWLVVSGSAKRSTSGRKEKTKRLQRTPLGDKGLGRLGSMRLGDILLVESATGKDAPLESARFRWADCGIASTVDEIPVFLETHPNTQGFKGTRVSVLGLRDPKEWNERQGRDKLRRGLTRLISPFEAKATFKVSLAINKPEQSLASVTEEVLNKSVSKFTFDWERDPDTGVVYLISRATFKSRLFTPDRKGAAKDKATIAFIPDKGAGFRKFLPSFHRMKGFSIHEYDPKSPWFIELTTRTPWTELIAKGTDSVTDPGPFNGAFYYFHLGDLGAEAPEGQTVLPNDRELIREMAGITILRDGFQVRSQGDWLDLASGMTSGSTYQLRPNNTVGYFDLTGEHNFALTEKSDREGFVENAAYRGFKRVAMQCKVFANEALESVRRGFDEYHKQFVESSGVEEPITTARSMALIERDRKLAQNVRSVTDVALQSIERDMSVLQRDPVGSAQAMKVAQSAFEAVRSVRAQLPPDDDASMAIVRLKQEFEENREQVAALFESAAVGMSARGLTHELRTHLEEIMSRSDVLEKAAKRAGTDTIMMPDLRAIKGACIEIRKAAALIDPMLPRSRMMRETFHLSTFVKDYLARRSATFESNGIRVEVVDGGAGKVRTNRSRLVQVIDNLVRNSTYWLTKAHGGPAREKVITIELERAGIVVSDSGPGVEAKVEESLFDIFVTTKPHDDPGQGLGLYIIRNLLQAEGCDIELQADRNPQGRRFRFAVDLKNIAVEG